MPILIIDDSDSYPTAIHSETIRIPVTVDLNPSVPTKYLINQSARLLVDGDEIGITYYHYDKGGVGTECNFTLADFSERQLIKDAETLDFQLSLDGTNWVTKAGSQELKTWSITTDKDGDYFNFSTVDSLASNLGRCPSVPLVMYDPESSPFDPSAVVAKKDNLGNEYAVEAIAIAGMTLEDVLNEVIIERCGISAYFTDIPLDTPIFQFSVEMGTRYFDALKGKIGEYEPTVELINGTLEIRDTTLALPDGFTPPDLTIDRCLEYAINAEETNADAVELTYTSTEYDFITTRPELFNEQFEEASGDLLVTNIIQYIHEYRNSLNPLVVQQEEIQNDYRDTTRTPGSIHESTKQITKTYDKYHRLVATTHREDTRVPDPANAGEFLFQEEEWVESQNIEYAQHPFNLNQSYQKTVRRQSTGLVIKDESNPYDYDKEPGAFTQGLRNAHRSGNISSDFSYLTGRDLETHTESFTPKKNGQVDYRYEGYDNVRGTPIKTTDTPRTGDLGLSSNYGEPQTLIVLPEGVSEKSNGITIPLAINGTARQGTPLARRILKKAMTAPGRAVLSIAGIRLDVKKGRPFLISSKEEGIEGVFLITSYSGEGRATQQGMVHTMRVTGTEIPYARDENISSYVIGLQSTESKTFTREIECWTGYEFYSETVSDVAVEGRKQGDVSWVNLETSSIDLDAYAGTTQTFEIRLTAGTITTVNEKTFDLIIAPA